MPRYFVFLVLLSSVALCGGTTCRFSTGDTKKKDNDGSEVVVVVDTRVSGGTGGTGAGPDSIEVVHAALETSVLASAAGGTPVTEVPPGAPLEIQSAGRAAPGTQPRRVATAIPEPGAIGLFLSGVGVLIWRLRRRR